MMSLSIVAAKDMEQAIEILASRPRKAVKDHLAEEPEGVGNFLYDFRAAFTNYQCYYRFDPYGETCLEMDQVPAIKDFLDSVRKWLAGVLLHPCRQSGYSANLKILRCQIFLLPEAGRWNIVRFR